MKKNATNIFPALALAGLLLMTYGPASGAMTSGTSGMSRDAGKLSAEITMLNSDANLPQGDTIIMKQLSENFNVGSDKVRSLLGSTMQFGDVAATLAFAEKLPGGITDANLKQVVNMRSKGGWEQVAKSLNVSVSDVAGKLSSIEDSTHRNIKQAFADSLSSGKAAGGVGGSAGAGTGGTDSGVYGGDGGTDSSAGSGGY